MSQEIALLKETNNQIAVRHGLPPVGSTMINQYGIEWLVDGHLFVPTLSTLARGTNLEEDDPRDLYPVILPQNLSPRLTNFIAETDRCTSKVIMPLDTVPYLRPHSAHPYGHWIDGLDSPHRILMFLDAAHAHETIIAHEIGHIWIDLVEDCEDYRIFKDLSDTPKVHQWTSLQSFVLDNKVNEVLREKGFDMSAIENDVEESLISFAAAIRSGYRPPTDREAAFVASTLATAMLDYETGAQNTLQSLDMTSTVFRNDLPDVYALACHLAASVRRHGYADRASIRKAVDACALLAFAFVGEPLNLDTDFVEEVPTEDYNDKYLEYFPGIPVAAKLEIARAMARLKIPGGSECRLEYSSTGSAQVKFCQPSGEWTKPVLLKNLRRLPQPSAFAGSNPMLQRGRPTMNKSFLSTPPNNSLHAGTNSPATSPPLSGLHPVFPTGGSNGRRSYGPGLARFLSQARLAEQLGGEHPYGYAMNNPISYVDPGGNQPQKPGQPNPPIGQDRHKPPDCTKIGITCKPVWFTCNPNKKGKKLAVYCKSDDGCTNQIYVIGSGKDQHRVPKGTPGARLITCTQPCGDVCKEYGRTLGDPVFERGSTVCIHGEHGNKSRTIDDCGCGQKQANKPQPDNWMDYEGEDCSGFKDGWRCVCPGPCAK